MPHAGRQRQQPQQSEGRLRHQTPEGRLRHAQCTSPAQRAVKKLDRVPLLMSGAQAAKQSQFETETPLPTAGLALELLPGSSRLDANGFGEHKTCAVVGASGSLLAAKHGALIDAHQQVIRINRVVTRDFEEYVGSRTTLNLFWGHRAHLDAWLARQRGPNIKPWPWPWPWPLPWPWP
jgi:hypothetical protein